MVKKSKTKPAAPILRVITKVPRLAWRCSRTYWQRKWWHKIVVVLVLLVGLSVGTMYGIARWYMWSESSKPLNLGASFIPDYARQFSLDPQKTMDAMISDLGIKHFRLVSYWSDIEKSPGKYDFTQLDWQFQKADAAHAKVTLSLGLRQPRWPECHKPKWIDTTKPESQWYPQLQNFIGAVVGRYKNNPALDSYQLENEYLLKVFGECNDFDRARLVREFNFVKQQDPSHPVVVARSNNALGTPIYAPTPDAFGVSVYKRVWDRTITHRYLEYPFPAWFYGFLAGTEKIIKGKETVIHELQAEPWPPNGQEVKDTPTAELNKSLDAHRLQGRFDYGEATGVKSIDLWGAEYWYYMKEKRGDNSLWNVAKTEYQRANIR
jgi:hypothetical protein